MALCPRCHGPLPKYLRFEQVMGSLEISRATLYRWIERGIIKVVRVEETGTLRISADDFDRFLREREVRQSQSDEKGVSFVAR